MISDTFKNTIWIYYETNLKARTRKEYWNVVKNFDKVVGHDPLELSHTDAVTYYEHILNKISKNQLKYSTGVMRLSVIRSVCNFIEFNMSNHGKEYTNYFKEISIPEEDKLLTDNDIPTLNEINNIMETIQQNNDEKAFLILSLAVKCALTNTEICSLNKEYIAINSNDEMYINYPPKGNNRISRIIKVPDDVAVLLDRYICNNNIIEGAIFINKRKTRIKLRDTERLLEKYCKLNIEKGMLNNKFTMQTLRHAAICYMLSGGASKDLVASYAGITTKWITRYDKIINSDTYKQAFDYSIISINA